MQFVMFMIIISVLFSVIASGLKARFEVLLASSVFGLIAVLYIGYILNCLWLGMVVAGFGVSILMYFSLRGYIKRKWNKDTVINTITGIINPQLILVITAICVNYHYTKGHFVKLMDELHLWAILPKLIFYNNGAFQQGADSLLAGFKDYIPGMPLWSWFCEVLNGGFEDNVLFCGYCCLGSILLLTGIRNITWKKWYMMIPAVFIVIYSPQMFYNTIFNDSVIWFKAIHVDMIMGVSLGVALYMIYIHWWENKWDTALFVGILVFNVLIKSSGIGMVLILAASSAVAMQFEKRLVSEKMLFFMSTGIPLLFWLSWSVVKKVYNIATTVPFKPQDMFNVVFFRNFLKDVLFAPVVRFNNVNTGLFAALPLVILFLTALMMNTLFFSKKRKQIAILSGTWIVMTAVFLAGLYVVYCWYADRIISVQSYPRYISTMLTALWIAWLFIMLEGLQELFHKAIWKRVYVAATILLCLVAFPRSYPYGILYPSVAYEQAGSCASQIINEVGTGKGLLILDDNYDDHVSSSQEYFYKRLRYDLMGNEGLDMCWWYMKESDMDIADNTIKLAGIDKYEPNGIEWISLFLLDDSGQTELSLYDVEYVGNEEFMIK